MGLPWWFSGLDSVLPMQGAWVQRPPPQKKKKTFVRRVSVAAGMVGKKQVKSRRAIKSRFFNVSGTGQKLKGNEAHVAGTSMELKCKHLKHHLEKTLILLNTAKTYLHLDTLTLTAMYHTFSVLLYSVGK